MKYVIRFLFILAYFLIQYVECAEQSTRERIALHKTWLEQRAVRKRLYLQQQQLLVNNNNRTKSNERHSLLIPSPFHVNSQHDLNAAGHSKIKSMKTLSSSLLTPRIKHKQKKYRFFLNDVSANSSKEKLPASQQTKSFVVPSKILSTTVKSTEKAIIDTETLPLPIPVTIVMTPKPDLKIENSTEYNHRKTLIGTTTKTAIIKSIEPSTIVTSTEHSIKYNVTSDESLNRKANKTKGKNNQNTKPTNAMWGRWHKWTKCSRSCGGGVMFQSRQCLNRNTSLKNRTSNECIGLQKRYRICNEQSCPDHEIDFREQQCHQYNNETFHGKRYAWEAYIIDDAECELNCKPIGMSYFATLNDRVIDGTTCYFPVDFVNRNNHSGRAMCVEGTCKAIHSSGIITGAFMNNGAVRCGATVCNPVTGIFNDNPLPNGYAHVATIPAGASNISILELKNSENFLVLKRGDHSFIINGGHKISDSGVYNAAGATFDYRRIDDAIETSDENSEGVTEWITSTGPIRDTITLMVLIQGKNPGIKYEYLMPIDVPPNSVHSDENNSVEMEADMPPPTTATSDTEQSAKQSDSKSSGENTSKGSNERRKRKHIYTWRVVSFSSCSKSCGGGTLSPIIRCVREGTSKFFAHKRCAHESKPVLNENVLRCNTQPCPAYWKIGEWSACNCGLPNEHEHQTRESKCVQELGTGIVIHVNDGACLESEPTNRQECSCPKQQVGFYRNPHKRNHRDKNLNRSASPVTLIGNSTIGKRIHVMENKKSGVWLSSDWNEQCSTKCGDGTQYRSIFCDRSAPKSERCDVRSTPDITRSCTATARCNIGDWFIGPWSECFGDCFSLSRSRSVLCIKDDQIVGDSSCIDSNNVENSTKPITIEKCELNAVSYCKPKWHYSEWTECTRNCGSGTQRRTVKCFESDLKERLMKETDNCRYSERPQAFRSCNTHECGTTSLPISEERPLTTTRKHVEPKILLVQNDSTPKCEDVFPNCHIVVKARLCTYEYYIQNCCATCEEAMAQEFN